MTINTNTLPKVTVVASRNQYVNDQWVSTEELIGEPTDEGMWATEGWTVKPRAPRPEQQQKHNLPPYIFRYDCYNADAQRDERGVATSKLWANFKQDFGRAKAILYATSNIIRGHWQPDGPSRVNVRGGNHFFLNSDCFEDGLVPVEARVMTGQRQNAKNREAKHTYIVKINGVERQLISASRLEIRPGQWLAVEELGHVLYVANVVVDSLALELEFVPKILVSDVHIIKFDRRTIRRDDVEEAMRNPERRKWVWIDNLTGKAVYYPWNGFVDTCMENLTNPNADRDIADAGKVNRRNAAIHSEGVRIEEASQGEGVILVPQPINVLPECWEAIQDLDEFANGVLVLDGIKANLCLQGYDEAGVACTGRIHTNRPGWSGAVIAAQKIAVEWDVH